MAKKNQTTEKTDKVYNYDEAQLAELRKIVTEAFEFVKEKTRPALDILLPSTAEKLVNQFLLEKKAEFLLDEQAISEGYESASDKIFQIEKKRKEDEALAKAKQDALDKAAKEEEERLLSEELALQKKLQEQRDKEDAERAAELKANLKAAAAGQSKAEIASV